MVLKYEFTATKEQADKVKREVSCFDDNPFFIVTYSKKKMELSIRFYEAGNISIDCKSKILRTLKEYCDALRMRIFNGEI